MENIKKRIKDFSNSRNWNQFHSGSNLAKSISIEANELLELFQWSDETDKIDEIKDEVADIFIYTIMLSEKYEIDIIESVNNKIDKNEKKYPVSKSYGSSKKYKEL